MSFSKTYCLASVSSTWIEDYPLAGLPVNKVQFFGCNLCCAWCNVKQSFSFNLSCVDIFKQLGGQPHMLLSGGEPSFQIDQPFVDRLQFHQQVWKALNVESQVIIETNGTNAMPIEIYHMAKIVVSPKPKTFVLSGDLYPYAFAKYVIPGMWKDVGEVIDSARMVLPEGLITSGCVIFQPLVRYGSIEASLAIMRHWIGEFKAIVGSLPSVSISILKYIDFL